MYEYKKEFVEGTLQETICTAYPEIEYLEYEYDEDTGQEWVHVIRENWLREHCPKVNVNMDSYSGILKDVMKYIWH